MSFEADMIVPISGFDDLGQEARASITFLRYALILGYRGENGARSLGPLEIVRETLSHIKLGDALRELQFDHAPRWRESAIRGKRRVPYFISTQGEGRVAGLWFIRTAAVAAIPALC
jgi:hypothetical protein